jgi:dGTPase
LATQPPARHDRRWGDGPADQRDAFQRDRDRILYSTALRRLAGITQVVGAAEGHIFHNRLTHTLEVAQLARRLAEKLRDGQGELAATIGGIEPEVAEAAALAHDLGHPPFGHVAESELNRIITGELDVRDGFEGNAQTFRVVTKLSIRHLDHPGQNLTRATLNAVLKYPWFRGRSGWKRKKYGAYSAERTDFHFARANQPRAARLEKSAEAEIMDWADDIAYAVHDVEDFYRAGFIPLDRLMDADDDELQRFIQGTFYRWKLEKFRPVRNHTDPQLRKSFTNLMEQLRFTQRIAEPYTGTREQRARLRSLTSLLISGYVQAISLREPNKANPRTVTIKREAEREITMLKQLTWFYVIQRPSLAVQQRGQKRVVGDLFHIFFEATESVASRDMLPIGARQFLEDTLKRTQDHDVQALRARVAADVVCSLSEQQGIALHQRLTGVDPGSVLYGIVP